MTDDQLLIKHLKAELKKVYRQNDKLRSRSLLWNEEVIEALKGIRFPKTKRPLIYKPLKKADHCTQVMGYSDIHCALRVLPQDTGGMGGYDMATCKLYSEEVFTEVVRTKLRDYKSHGLSRIFCCVMGDLIENSHIYKGQENHAETTNAVEQMMFLMTECLWPGLKLLAENYDEVMVPWVYGNHGRKGDKGADHLTDNYDYIIGLFTKQAFKDVPNVHIVLSESPELLIGVNDNFNMLVGHGDRFGGGAIPYAKLEQHRLKVHMQYKKEIHCIFSGHTHNPFSMTRDRMIKNGCLCGGTDLSINTLHFPPEASQTHFRVHPTKGVQAVTNIRLEPNYVMIQYEGDHGAYTPTTNGDITRIKGFRL